MKTVGDLIQKYLNEHDLNCNEFANHSDIDRQRVYETVKKGRCPSDKNFQKLLAGMNELTNKGRQELVRAHQQQKNRIADNKIKDGKRQRITALANRFLDDDDIQITPITQHQVDNGNDSSKGLHSILEVMPKRERSVVVSLLKSREEVEGLHRQYEKKGKGKLKYVLPEYVTRVDCMISVHFGNGKKFVWVLRSIFDGCYGDRVKVNWCKILRDIPLRWIGENQPLRKKGHPVEVRCWWTSEPNRQELHYDSFLKELRQMRPKRNGQGEAQNRGMYMPAIAFAVAQKLERMKESDEAKLLNSNRKAVVDIGAIDELSNQIEVILDYCSRNDKRKPTKNMLSNLQFAADKLRLLAIQNELNIIMVHWAMRYFQDLQNQYTSK